jgi:ectoine hydroxylase-related dioxygenase (phytanoyl-CoA dioxygenase family)
MGSSPFPERNEEIEMALQTLAPDAGTEAILAAITRDGACIVADVIDAATVRQMVDEVGPYIDRTPYGADDFTGRRTQRTGALVARTPTCRELVLDARVLAAARTFLKPWADRILLHLTQTICIHPGQGAQVLHRDRLAWGTALPLSIEPQFNTIWALTDFTAENGATRVVPGSQHWAWDQKAAPGQVVQAEMRAGSVLLYSGTVLHSGGENRAQAARLGLNITYCLGWLRQEENQYLSCPPHIARHLEPELQELLGYTQGNYALGYYSDPESNEPGRDILPPEFALGRAPRKGYGLSLADATDAGATTEMLRKAADQLGETV